MEILKYVNYLTAIVLAVCYSYQFIYMAAVFFSKKRKHKSPVTDKKNRYAILICARNEEEVITDLIDSIGAQTYPRENLHCFVMADNCTDDTAFAAHLAGADVYIRNNRELVGKGYALDALLGHIREDYPEGFDGYFVFDADNILSSDYIEQMDRTFSEGNDIVTSYRNSKNYGSNWISAGYALWFLRESRYLNHARSMLGASCAVSGTGFMFSRKVLEEMGGGWPHHLLVEDIEFSISSITKGRRIGFCPDAEIFDEQPVEFRQSWKQRMRWSRGYLQVFKAYGARLIKGIFHGSFSCYDMSMSIMPAFMLTVLSVISNLTLGIWGAAAGDDIGIALRSAGELALDMYAMLFVFGTVTTISEWKRIRTSAAKKILYNFTFPLFMATYIPIAVVSLFKDTGWEPIKHNVTLKKMRAGGELYRI